MHTLLDFLRSLLLCLCELLDLSFSLSSRSSTAFWCLFLCFLLLSLPDLFLSLQTWVSIVSSISTSSSSFLVSLSCPLSFSLLCFAFLFSLSSLSFSFFACRILKPKIYLNIQVYLFYISTSSRQEVTRVHICSSHGSNISSYIQEPWFCLRQTAVY